MRAGDPHVPCGSVECPRPEQDLDGARLHPGLEQRGRAAMAQGMDACAVLDVGSPLGVGVDLLGRSHGPRFGAGWPWKQPPWRAIQLPIGPQFGQQTGGEEGVAVLPPLALLDPDQPAITCDVGQLQMHDCADAPARGVGRHQQGAVLGVPHAGAEALACLHTQDTRELQSPWARREGEGEDIPAEGLGRAKLQSRGCLMAGTPRQVPFDQQVMEGGVDLVWAESVG